MDNKRIILWLVLFFPVGIYLMFKESDWSNTVKIGISAFFMMLVMLGGFEVMSIVLMIGTFVFLFLGGLSFIRKKSHLKSLAFIASSLLLFAGSYHITETIEAEQIAIEKAEIRAQEERDRIAEKKKQAEIAKQKELERIEEQKELERIEKQKALRVQILSTLDKVEAEPTIENYNAVTRILSNLDSKSDIETRLAKIKPEVDAYEETRKIARDAVVLAETEKSRSSYDEAVRVVSSLSVTDKGLDIRLNQLSSELDQIEEEQLAAEKEAYEAELKIKNEEKRKSREAYEAEMKTKNEEKRKSREEYEAEMKTKNEEKRKSREAYDAEMKAKNEEKAKSREAYEAEMKQRNAERDKRNSERDNRTYKPRSKRY